MGLGPPPGRSMAHAVGMGQGQGLGLHHHRGWAGPARRRLGCGSSGWKGMGKQRLEGEDQRLDTWDGAGLGHGRPQAGLVGWRTGKP